MISAVAHVDVHGDKYTLMRREPLKEEVRIVHCELITHKHTCHEASYNVLRDPHFSQVGPSVSQSYGEITTKNTMTIK